MNLTSKIFRNKKNGKMYIALHTCINAANENSGQEMIIYICSDKEDKNIYVREVNEFYDTFQEEDS